MTGDELATLMVELIEDRVNPPFIEVTAPHRTDHGWHAPMKVLTSESSYYTAAVFISDGHSDARVRAYVAAVGRYVRAGRRIPVHLWHAPTSLDAPVGDDAFDRILNDPRAQHILDRASRNARLAATLDPERRGSIPQLANPDLEAAIVEDPDNSDAYAVYGDWLAQRGDPRGELIAVQLARRTRPDDATLAERETELLDIYAYEWLGALAWPYPGEMRIKWNYGFIQDVVFTRPDDEDSPAHNSLLDAVRTLRTLPGLACLRDVELTGENHWPGPKLWSVLAEVGLPPSVRRLAITATKRFLAKPVEVSPIYPALAGLDALEIGFQEIHFGPTLPLPNLRSLTLYWISRENMAALRASSWPRLERLFLWLQGDGSEGMQLTLADHAWLLEAASVPALRYLGLGGTLTAELIAELAASPLVRQISTLDLSEAWGTFEEALEAAMPALAHLEVLPPRRRG